MWSQYLPSTAALLFFVPSAVFAVTFSEIMYDVSGNDSGREWIEIHNEGTVPMDLSNARLVEAGVRHKIISLKGSIPPMGYGIIASNPDKFLSDWPSYSGPLFDSAFSLSNSGETLSLEVPSTTPIVVTYTGGASNGNSYNNISGSWVLRSPSPGSAAKSEAIKVEKSSPKLAKNEGNVSASAVVRGETEPESEELPASLGGTRDSGFGIIPWIAGLVALVLVGMGAIFLTGSKKKSGYTIIEDNS